MKVHSWEIDVGIVNNYHRQRMAKTLAYDGTEVERASLDPEFEELVKACAEAQKLAYCPYSKFSVGAALRAENGQIFTGCNVENASFGASICAERTAAVKAISIGIKKFTTVAVIAKHTEKENDQRDYTPPCGICRQFLIEFGDIPVICVKSDLSSVRIYKLSSLLPEGFVSF